MCFGPKMPKYGNSTPGSLKLRFLRFLSFIRCGSPICFKQALNHNLKIILSPDIYENVFWAQNDQIW